MAPLKVLRVPWNDEYDKAKKAKEKNWYKDNRILPDKWYYKHNPYAGVKWPPKDGATAKLKKNYNASFINLVKTKKKFVGRRTGRFKKYNDKFKPYKRLP